MRQELLTIFIVALMVVVLYLTYKRNTGCESDTEGFDNSEAIANIASIYTSNPLTVNSASITQSLKVGSSNGTTLQVVDKPQNTDVMRVYKNSDGNAPYFFYSPGGALGISSSSGPVFYVDASGRVQQNITPAWVDIQNSDLPGEDMRSFASKGFDDCKSYCKDDPRCTHVVFRGDNTCWLKSLPTPGNTVLGTKRLDNTFIRYHGQDRPGFSYSSSSANDMNDCESRCGNDSQCLLYVYRYNDKGCWLKKPNSVQGLTLSQKA
ncbi:hypothetical protein YASMINEVIRUS_1037 [Yasminevirus sp. GU-2018]|uniref:Apple domain-containing protein n=1 Tax=Yasminevirus sp. GU-2018 TaxID=2420051 RepID=A0A5K0UAR9_9VIRU|nr:hypothetical protein YASMINEVIRUS_1037 [Yasminevirus sp. GU-2018]